MEAKVLYSCIEVLTEGEGDAKLAGGFLTAGVLRVEVNPG